MTEPLWGNRLILDHQCTFHLGNPHEGQQRGKRFRRPLDSPNSHLNQVEHRCFGCADSQRSAGAGQWLCRRSLDPVLSGGVFRRFFSLSRLQVVALYASSCKRSQTYAPIGFRQARNLVNRYAAASPVPRGCQLRCGPLSGIEPKEFREIPTIRLPRLTMVLGGRQAPPRKNKTVQT
jgi:hypothetical protein